MIDVLPLELPLIAVVLGFLTQHAWAKGVGTHRALCALGVLGTAFALVRGTGAVGILLPSVVALAFARVVLLRVRLIVLRSMAGEVLESRWASATSLAEASCTIRYAVCGAAILCLCPLLPGGWYLGDVLIRPLDVSPRALSFMFVVDLTLLVVYTLGEAWGLAFEVLGSDYRVVWAHRVILVVATALALGPLRWLEWWSRHP